MNFLSLRVILPYVFFVIPLLYSTYHIFLLIKLMMKRTSVVYQILKIKSITIEEIDEAKRYIKLSIKIMICVAGVVGIISMSFFWMLCFLVPVICLFYQFETLCICKDIIKNKKYRKYIK
jgi:hypothetical protein